MGQEREREREEQGPTPWESWLWTASHWFPPFFSLQVSCQMRHGFQLASILSAREANVVYSYLRLYGPSSVWIGLAADRRTSNMIWEWSDGSVFSQPLWDGRRISNSISSDECVSVSYSGSQKWIQRSCTTTLPYLCKYKATDYA
ncbi:lithostathine-like [Podarcis raffonei]|uniref:lithostathine-like n=1 Tax=Podarcis raffonei TaxID=65483 RepID=UPI00232966FE|nr:lithostathine-like [Podarcis raffonei]